MDRISEIASAQHGVVGVQQLHALGLDNAAVTRHIDRGQLHRLHVGVYAVGHTALTETALRLAAVLAGGTHALAARWSAGRHLAFLTRSEPKGILEVATPDRQPRRPGLRFLRLASLTPEDVWVVDAVPCTSASRTLFDLASVLSLRDLERAAERAEYRDQLDITRITEIAARIDRPRGVRNLRRALDLERLGASHAGSELERLFLELILAAGFPRPHLQRGLVIEPGRQIRVDFFWPNHRLVIEIDGPHHERPLARRRDAERDAGLRALGLTVYRVSYRDLEERPTEVLAAVRALFASSSVQPHSHSERFRTLDAGYTSSM